MEINGKKYNLTYSLRSMFVFESITDKPFEIKTLMDTYVFCYSCIVADRDNPSLEFNEFIDWCDQHPDALNEFNKFLEVEMKKREIFTNNKKKVTRTRKKS